MSAPLQRLPIDLTGLGRLPRRRAGLGLTANFSIPGTPYQAKLPNVTQADVTAALPSGLQGSYAQIASQYNSNVLGQTGAQSAIALVNGGFNPSSTDDQQKLVHIYAGAVSLVPVIGPVMGGLTEAAYQFGRQLAQWPPMQQLMGLCNDPAGCCQHSGNWTAAEGMSLGNLSPQPKSFAGLVVPVLVDAWAHAMNCDRQSFWNFSYSNILPVLVALWNQYSTNQNEEQDYFVPLLNAWDRNVDLVGGGAPVPDAPPLMGGYSTGAARALGLAAPTDAGPLAYPTPSAVNTPYYYAYQGHWAFSPLVYVPTSVTHYGSQSLEGITWSRIRAKQGPMYTPEQIAEIQYAIGLYLQRENAAKAAAANPLNNPWVQAALVGIVGGAAAAAGGSLYALATGQAVGRFWTGLWGETLSVGAKAGRDIARLWPW